MTESTNTESPIDMVAAERHTESADSTLGQRMGRDARRVARGELSEAEFYEKYTDEVVDTFGFDHRPVGDDE